MGARLTTAIKIADSANAILQRVNAFDQEDMRSKKDWDMRAHLGIDPMLLGLSMELALKAWFVFDHDKPKVLRSHNLPKLFAALKSESQDKLESTFRQSVAPYHPNIFIIDYGIRSVLLQHENAFEDWRYSYEARHLSFEKSVFIATLEMVLREFKKRYRTEKIPPVWNSE